MSFIVLGCIFCQWNCIGGVGRKEMNLNMFSDGEKKDSIAILSIYIIFVW